MAYMSQDRKKEIAEVVKVILKEYGVKGTLAVRHHSTLVLNINSGCIDFIGNYVSMMDSTKLENYLDFRPSYLDINPYHYRDHFDGKAKEFLNKVFNAMNKGNHDNSDVQTDYFDVGWYVDINIGRWDKPYILKTI